MSTLLLCEHTGSGKVMAVDLGRSMAERPVWVHCEDFLTLDEAKQLRNALSEAIAMQERRAAVVSEAKDNV